jgi:hypothetical protein
VITADYLARRIRFVGDDFFNIVEIRDGSRAPYEVRSKIELPQSFEVPYFREGEETNVSIQDITAGRPREERFHFGFEAKLLYGADLEEQIRVTLGNEYDKSAFRDVLRIMEDAKKKTLRGLF